MPERRLPILILLVALLAFPATASAKRASAPIARVSVPTCQSELMQANRVVEFTGDMRTVKGAQRLEMRFSLQVRTGGPSSRWRTLKAPGFNQWLSSDPGVRRYRYTKRVQNLVAPARYRVQTRFRWIDGDGDRVRSKTVRSPSCMQRDLRPNMNAVALERLPAAAAPGRAYYRATVRNGGATATAPFGATLTVNGTPQTALSLVGFAAGEQRAVLFDGPACRPGTRISVQLDPGGVITERNEGDNVINRAC